MVTQRTILNDPTSPSVLHGTSLYLAKLGQEIPAKKVGPHPWWWPSAPSQRARKKLYNRATRGTLSFQFCLAICVSLLKEIYTTFPNSSEYLNTIEQGPEPEFLSGYRIRLKYGSSPITDFGICIGSIEHSEKDCLAANNTGSMSTFFNSGPDPEQHAWIYFKTAHGQELVLDFTMYFFNDPHVIVNKSDYIPSRFDKRLRSRLDFIAGDLQDSMSHLRDFKPRKRTVKKRLSVLHNKELQKAVEVPYCAPVNIDLVATMFEKGLGWKPMKIHNELMAEWIKCVSTLFMSNLVMKDWKKYPAEPTMELDILPKIDDDDSFFHCAEVEWWIENVKRLFDEHEPTEKEIHELYRKWRRLPVGVRSRSWDWERDKFHWGAEGEGSQE